MVPRAQNEPAVEHVILAICSLYEVTRETMSPRTTPLNTIFAIRHYNAAIRCMLSPPPSRSLDNLPLLCALFICVELLRGDTTAAINHCSLGIGLINSMPGNSGVASIIYRLNVLPLFFETMATAFHVVQQQETLIDLHLIHLHRLRNHLAGWQLAPCG